MSAVVVAAAALAVGRAEADEPLHGRFSAATFDPAPAGDRFYRIEAPELLGHGAYDALVLADVALNPFVVSRPDESGEKVPRPVVASQAIFHVGGAVTLWDRWKLSLDMPFGSSRVAGDVQNPTEEVTEGWSAGDARVGLRFRVGGDPGDGFILALSGLVWLPTGDEARLMGEGAARGGPRIVLGGRLAPITWGYSGGFVFRPKAAVARVETGSQFVVDTGFSAPMSRFMQVAVEIHAASVIEGEDALEKETTNIEVLVGPRVRVGDFVFGVAPSVGRGFGTESILLRAVASISFSPLERMDLSIEDEHRPPDRPPQPRGNDMDHDGIVDWQDACPSVPGSRSSSGGRSGCPDADADGVFDADDLCPARPGPAGGNRSGCPVQDRDRDGIADPDDSCPDLAGLQNAVPRDHGCPADADADGVYDGEDACPTQRGRFSIDRDKNGCPREKAP